MGCSVLTRPPMISGKPVKSSIEPDREPAVLQRRGPFRRSTRARSPAPRARAANSTIPRLSDTDSSARRTRTSPGWVIRRARIQRPHANAPRVLGVERDGAGGDQPDGLGSSVVLDRPQRVADRAGGSVASGQLERALGDDRPRVDALVDEVDRDPEDLHAVRRAPARPRPGRGRPGSSAGMDVDHALREARQEARDRAAACSPRARRARRPAAASQSAIARSRARRSAKSARGNDAGRPPRRRAPARAPSRPACRSPRRRPRRLRARGPCRGWPGDSCPRPRRGRRPSRRLQHRVTAAARLERARGEQRVDALEHGRRRSCGRTCRSAAARPSRA